MTNESLDLVSMLDDEDRVLQEHSLRCISPDDAKYGKQSTPLKDYLSADAEWRTCAYIQYILIQTRHEFGQADIKYVNEVKGALEKISPLNMSLLEENVTRHDQLAVIEEIGRFVSEEAKALLHPGTTSYDILDTARSYLFRGAWFKVMRPEAIKSIEALCDLAERSLDVIQVGRTHLQDTSPITFGSTLAGYAARLANRVELNDQYFNDLRGKISGIVGTGASIEMVMGEGEALEFERLVLEKLDLEPDLTSTQIVQKERLADVGHGLTTFMYVMGDLANDIRLLYSSAIGEVTSRDNSERLGGSSSDATKNNPINWENIAGTPEIVQAGMGVLYSLIRSDLHRDLRGSKQARYYPQLMMAEVYEPLLRLNKALQQLSINHDRMTENLIPVRDNPGEAMVAILRGEKWVSSEYGVGHDFVKAMGKRSKREGRTLLEVSLNLGLIPA